MTGVSHIDSDKQRQRGRVYEAFSNKAQDLDVEVNDLSRRRYLGRRIAQG